jgi:hypothetical protein
VNRPITVTREGSAVKSKKAKEHEPKLISIAEATKAIQWFEEFMHSDSPDAAQERVVCGLIRGLKRVYELEHTDGPTLPKSRTAKVLKHSDTPLLAPLVVLRVRK